MTRPFHFGGWNKGKIQGKGLINKGCVQQAINDADIAKVTRKIVVNPQVEDQTMDGFGASMTESSAYLIWHHPKRAEVSQI